MGWGIGRGILEGFTVLRTAYVGEGEGCKNGGPSEDLGHTSHARHR